MTVTHKRVPIEVSLRTPRGAVKVPPITFAVIPGSDDVVLFDKATIKALDLDLHPWALEKLRPRAVPVQTGVENPSFLVARRVTSLIKVRLRTMLLGTSRWSVWSRGGQTCSWTQWRREVPDIERLRIAFSRPGKVA